METPYSFPQWLHKFEIPPTVHEGFRFLTACQHWFVDLLMMAILTGVRGYLTVVLFAILWWLVMLSIFSYVYWSSVCPLWRNVYSGLLPIFKSNCLSRLFVFLALSCISYLYILDINSFGCIICKYLLLFCRLSFRVIEDFHCCAKMFQFDVVLLFIFLLFPSSKKTYQKQILLKTMSVNLLPVFSSRNFIVSSLTFKSLPYWVYSCTLCRSTVKIPFFFFLQIWYCFSNTTYWRHCLYPNLYSCLLCHRLIDDLGMGLFLGFFVLLIYVSEFIPTPCCYGYSNLTV